MLTLYTKGTYEKLQPVHWCALTARWCVLLYHWLAPDARWCTLMYIWRPATSSKERATSLAGVFGKFLAVRPLISQRPIWQSGKKIFFSKGIFCSVFVRVFQPCRPIHIPGTWGTRKGDIWIYSDHILIQNTLARFANSVPAASTYQIGRECRSIAQLRIPTRSAEYLKRSLEWPACPHRSSPSHFRCVDMETRKSKK